MKVNVNYMAQVKKIVGLANEIVELDKSCLAQDFIVNNLCRRYPQLTSYLLDENNSIRDLFAIFVDDIKVGLNKAIKLRDGSEITIISPITGG